MRDASCTNDEMKQAHYFHEYTATMTHQHQARKLDTHTLECTVHSRVYADERTHASRHTRLTTGRKVLDVAVTARRAVQTAEEGRGEEYYSRELIRV